MGIDSATTHRRERWLQNRVRSLEQYKTVMGPALDRHELRHKVARELAAKHGFAEELLIAQSNAMGAEIQRRNAIRRASEKP